MFGLHFGPVGSSWAKARAPLPGEARTTPHGLLSVLETWAGPSICPGVKPLRNARTPLRSCQRRVAAFRNARDKLFYAVCSQTRPTCTRSRRRFYGVSGSRFRRSLFAGRVGAASLRWTDGRFRGAQRRGVSAAAGARRVGLSQSGHHLYRVRRRPGDRAAFSLRSVSAGDSSARVGAARAWPHPAGARPQPLFRRRVPRPGDSRGGPYPGGAGPRQPELSAVRCRA